MWVSDRYKQAMSSSAVIQGFNDGTYNKKLRKMSCVKCPDLFAHCYQIKIPLNSLH